MNDKQKKFADEYLIDRNGAAAAIRAGYSETNPNQVAYELRQNPKIKAYIEEQRNIEADQLGIDRAFIMKSLKEIHEMSMSNSDASGANKSIESLGKIIGIFEKDNNQKKNEIQIVIDSVDDQL